MSSTSLHETFSSQEFMHDLWRISVLAIDRIIQLLHLLVGNAPRQLADDLRHFGMLLYGLLAYHRHRLVGWKIMAVVFEHEQVERRNQPIGGIARGEIDLPIF